MNFTRGTPESAGHDLYYQGETIKLEVSKTYRLKTGLKYSPPKGYCAIIKERSGMALKGFAVHAGVIDSDFELEWEVICSVRESLVIEKGSKIAQFLVVQVVQLDCPIIVPARIAGFGSTGY